MKATRSPTAHTSRSPKIDARPIAGAGLLHPVVLGAVALLIANDHFLKRAFPGFVTGKLSDFAGLAFFPLLLQAMWEALLTSLRRPWSPSKAALIAAISATALAFTLAKTTAPGADAYRLGLGLLQWPITAARSIAAGNGLPAPRSVSFTRDPSDLMALPALAIPLWVGLRRVRRESELTSS